jgi:hypothetical protein
LSKPIEIILDKNQYQIFINTYKEDVPVYYWPSYLDAVAFNQWEGLVLRQENDIIAIFPIHYKSKYGFKFLLNPPLVQYSGLWLATSQIKRYKECVYLIDDYIKKRFHLINLSLHQSQHNHLEWKWKGYKENIKFTFIIYNEAIETILAKYHKVTRSDLRFVKEKLTISNDKSNVAYHLLNKGLIKSGLSEERSNHLIENLLKLPYAKLYNAVDENNFIQASILTIEDHHTTYNIINGRSNECIRGGVKILLDAAIKESVSQNKNFDFEGSSIPGVYEFFESFGGKLISYHNIYKVKYTWIESILKTMKKI